MSALKVHSLFIYPIKGARAVEGQSFDLEPRGPIGDRRYVVTDENGKFLTQRNCSELAQLIAELHDGGLALRFGGDEIFVRPDTRAARQDVIVWNDTINACSIGGAADQWLTQALGRKAHLFFMDDSAERQTSGNWGERAPVSFADGYPLLVTTTASLSALNNEIESGDGDVVGMERFRPNIVIDGADPWAEDFWQTLKIGEVEIELVKPCTRCIVTTKNQETGKTLNKEPLKSLKKLRSSAHPNLPGVLFGWNALVRASGPAHNNDEVHILHERPEGWACS